jgi:hypothetical protein
VELSERLIGEGLAHDQIAQPGGRGRRQQLHLGATALGLGIDLAIPFQGLLEPTLSQEIAERRGTGH